MVKHESINISEKSQLVIGGSSSENTTRVDHYIINSIKTCQVSETELRIIESDSSSLLFNIALSFISMSVPLFVSYLACSFPNKLLEGIYISASISLLIFAFILLYINHNSKKLTRDVFTDIKERMNIENHSK